MPESTFNSLRVALTMLKKIILVPLGLLLCLPIWAQQSGFNLPLNYAMEMVLAENFEAAIPAFEKAVEIDSNNSSIRFERAKTFRAMGRYKESLRDLDKCLELQPNLASLLIYKGEVESEAGMYDLAIKDFSQVISNLVTDDQKYRYAPVYYSRAKAHYNIQQHPACIADMTSFIERFPQNGQAYYQRGLSYHFMGQYEEALGDYKKSATYLPSNEELLYARGLTHYTMGKYDLAMTDYKEALLLDPEFTDAKIQLGLAYDAQRKPEEGLKLLDQVVEGNPASGYARYIRGKIYWSTRNKSEACTDWEQAVELGFDEAKSSLDEFCRWSDF